MALWRLGVILNLNVSFLCKTQYFPFRLLQLFKQALSRRIGEAGSKCSSQLSMRQQAMPCKPNSHPANSIRHAYSRYEYVCANTIGTVNVHILCKQAKWIYGKLVSSYWLKFATLRLFVETMPIYKAVATGNGKNQFYRETTRSNCKQPSIATVLY